MRPDHPLATRQSGLLLHPTSLPGRHGVGDLGPEARAFVDWLVRAGVRLWQVLPLCPPGGPREDVPYASTSALSGHPLLVSLDDLHAEGLVEAEALRGPTFPEGWAELERVRAWKVPLLRGAAERLLDAPSHPLRGALEAFRAREGWAEETALFDALRAEAGGAPWWTWPAPVRHRDPAALAAARRRHARALEVGVALQFLFERQWAALRAYARSKGIRLVGDVPIYVLHDSADVWAHREGFRVSADGALLAHSGCPPDEFTAEGQLWGGPLYDWAAMARDDHAWWRARLARALVHADVVRVDHFRALAAAWEIPPGGRPRDGRWVPGPGRAFFDALERHLGPLPLCVEDLGAIDAPVIALRDALGFPGVRVLHYAFGAGADNPHLPHNHPVNAIACPANHDNDTTVGWWRALDAGARNHAQRYLGRHGDDIAWDLIRASLASVASTAVVQMQDVLALGSEARMNEPGSYARPPATWRNWRWRMLPGAADGAAAERLAGLNALYGRRPPAPA